MSSQRSDEVSPRVTGHGEPLPIAVARAWVNQLNADPLRDTHNHWMEVLCETKPARDHTDAR